MQEIEARVVLDSISPDDYRLTTIECVYPRIIHAEVMTHRVFSRLSASSRAIPIQKMIDRVKEDPFIPKYIQSNQAGMSGGSDLSDIDRHNFVTRWQDSSLVAVRMAEAMAKTGAHKQLVNRVLEPYLWHKVAISSTEWDNFFRQRLGDGVEPHMRELAMKIKDALDKSTPSCIWYGDWHLPYLRESDSSLTLEEKIKVSVARSARTSYGRANDEFTLESDLGVFQKMWDGYHPSPFEFVAHPVTIDCQTANYRGWKQLRRYMERNIPVVSAIEGAKQYA